MTDLLGDRGGARERCLRQHDGEFLAAHARAPVVLAGQRLLHAAYEFHQHVVARRMAVPIVDVFEVIDVAHQQREVAAETARALELASHVVHEIAPVVCAGE